MHATLTYRASLGLTIALTVVGFILALAWAGTLVRALGSAPWPALLPWKPLVLAALIAANCSLRKRAILRRRAAG